VRVPPALEIRQAESLVRLAERRGLALHVADMNSTPTTASCWASRELGRCTWLQYMSFGAWAAVRPDGFSGDYRGLAPVREDTPAAG